MGKSWVLGLVIGLAGVSGAQTAAPPEAPAVARAAAGASLKLAAPVPPLKLDATPAMWKVKGTHGTVYLFGTVHVMKKEVRWETPLVKAALKSSDVLYLEIADLGPEATAALQPMIMKLGMDAAHPLSTKIPKSDIELLDAAAKGLGAAGESTFESLQPWMVYLTLSVLPAVQAGYDPSSGIDQVLLAEAKGQGKRVKGFETADEQLHDVADFSMPLQVELLHQTLVDLPKSVGEMNEMVGDWTRGEVDRIGALDDVEMKVQHPELYDKLLVKRNEKFAETIGGLLNDPATGTVFVAIGAAHLAGGESVVKMLETRGFKAARVE